MMNEWWRSIPGAYLYINLHGREGPLRKRFAQESLELEARKSTCLSLSLAHGLGGSFLTRKTEDRNWRKDFERFRSLCRAALRPQWQRTAQNGDRERMTGEHLPSHMSGAEGAQSGCPQAYNGGRLGFILWQWIQVLIGRYHEGPCANRRGPLVATHENHKEIPKLSGRDLGWQMRASLGK